MPWLNTVIRELACGLHYAYGVNRVLGIEGGYKAFMLNTVPLSPKVIDKSFGFDTAVEAQRAINAAHVEAESFENGVGVVKLTGRYSGAGQELLCESMRAVDQQDASGNKLLQDVGSLCKPAKDEYNSEVHAHSAIHEAMAGYTGFTVGPENGRHAYIPFHQVTERKNKVMITDRMWARLLSSTNQPSFLDPKRAIKDKNAVDEETQCPLLNVENHIDTLARTHTHTKKQRRDMAMILNINFMGFAILAMAGILISNGSNVGLGQPCEGDLQGLITQCAMYVQKGGPRMDPSQGCCNVIKYVDIPCVCKYISKDMRTLLTWTRLFMLLISVANHLAMA
ncbi:hypothetical protein GH714_020079 [Hevea brasiliensis]|uniref:Bifunctional inhibitor/plant lipid transfer protein/seed storage helical domain-containing protein n=1 Tax=Hevea brasiliensis TaxID=3981 RepID=A0A6A6LI69_HEVBR|nr:hypothetical protein GH714_020079 [Hevea brasiliensis]